MTMVSGPRDIDQDDLERALTEFAEVLESGAVLTSAEELREFRDPFWPVDDDTYSPSAVVMPRTTEQVQQIVRIAGRHGVPIWTHSTGRNNAYGGPAPRVGGSVVVSLRNMNRVLEINEELAYAVVEPGVQWYDLYDALRSGGHELTISVPDLGWGSVVGNSLDGGVTYLPYGRDGQAPCGMEVVLADGSLLRTGTGGIPDNNTWHLYKRGLGPGLDPLFIQSNYGIVTRMGVWLMPRPQAYMALRLVLWDLDEVGAAIDTVRRLCLDDFIQGVPTFRHGLALAAQVAPRSRWYDGEGPIPEQIQEQIGRELNVGRWAMRFGLWGDEDLVQLRLAKIRRAFEVIPSAELQATRYSGEEVATGKVAPEDKVLAGIPNQKAQTMAGWYGGEHGGHVGLSLIVPLTGASFTEITGPMRRLVEQAGFDYLDGCLVVNERSLIVIVGIRFDNRDTDQTRRAYELVRVLAIEAGKRGYGENRAHIDLMDVAADQYSWNDHAYRRFCAKIKDAVDPAGILSPGRYGIWPGTTRTT